MEQEAKQKIIQKIEQEQITMRPKSYFIFRGILLALALVISALVSIFLISLVIFWLKLRGVLMLPGFGFNGILDLLLSLPFLIILLILLFSFLFWQLSEQFSIAYRKPVIYTLFAVMFIVLLGGFGVAGTSLHHNMFKRYSASRESGFMKTMYVDMGRAPIRNGVIGEIVEISVEPPQFYLVTAGKRNCLVTLDASTLLPSDKILEEGDWVFAYGQPSDVGFNATAVKYINSNEFMLEHFENGNVPRAWTRLEKNCR